MNPQPTLVVNIMYEQWDPSVAPGLGPMGNPLPGGVLDHQALGWADYGWRTGVWEVLDVLEGHGVSATFYVSGLLTETAPDSVVAITEGGHELAAHGWAQNRIPAVLQREEHEKEVRQCRQALEEIGRQRPRGWVSPRCTPGQDTAEILARAGYTWFGDVFDTDLPYTLQTAGGAVTALPFGLEVNDLPMTVRYGRPMSDMVSSFAHVARAQARRRRPGHIDVTLHAHVGCRPPGLLALSEIIDAAREAGMDVATRATVADRFLAAGEGGASQAPT